MGLGPKLNMHIDKNLATNIYPHGAGFSPDYTPSSYQGWIWIWIQMWIWIQVCGYVCAAKGEYEYGQWMPESSKSEFPLTGLNKDKYFDLDTKDSLLEPR